MPPVSDFASGMFRLLVTVGQKCDPHK